MSFVQHEGHAVRRGPFADPVRRGWVCIDCHLVGETYRQLLDDVPDWAEQDYFDNVDWIEG